MKEESRIANRGSDGRFRKSDIKKHLKGGVLLLAALLGLTSIGIVSANNARVSDDELSTTRQALKEWLDYCDRIAREKHEFEETKEMLKERIELVRNEIDSLREKTDKAKTEIDKNDEVRAEKVKENEKLKEVIASLGDTATMLEDRTRKLLKRLPDPIRQRVKPLSQQIPEDPDDTKLSISQRFVNIAAILNEVNKFNRKITVTSERRKLPDGRSVEVTTLYVGIGQGYYTGSDGKIAGVGRPTESGWSWTPANDIAEQISRVIAINENEEVASFVQLPIEIED